MLSFYNKISVYCFLLIFILSAATVKRSSSGAPPSHTGAPGEKTCTNTGCHDDAGLNKGTAELSLQILNSDQKIIPGKKYSLQIQLTDPASQRFGFQLLALDHMNENCGEFVLTDSIRTQIVKNLYEHKERTYLTYTFPGTDEHSAGKGLWTVSWVAPDNVPKDVTFYLAGVSANDDMSDKGDEVYTKKYSLKK